MARTRELLEDVSRHLSAAIVQHEAGNRHAVRYRIGKAKRLVDDELGYAMSTPDAMVNPTGAQGAQTSDGHNPRAASARRRAARGMIRGTAAIRSESGGGADVTKVIASTNEIARDGWVVEPSGLKTGNFLRSAAILFNHNYEQPVATPISAQLIGGGSALAVEIEWPPEGVSDRADEVRGLVKAGVIRAVSIGFLPIETEPLDPKEPWGGQRVLSADLLELSFVGVPADTGAVVTQRSRGSAVSPRAARQRRLAKLIAQGAPEERQRRIAELIRLGR